MAGIERRLRELEERGELEEAGEWRAWREEGGVLTRCGTEKGVQQQVSAAAFRPSSQDIIVRELPPGSLDCPEGGSELAWQVGGVWIHRVYVGIPADAL